MALLARAKRAQMVRSLSAPGGGSHCGRLVAMTFAGLPRSKTLVGQDAEIRGDRLLHTRLKLEITWLVIGRPITAVRN